MSSGLGTDELFGNVIEDFLTRTERREAPSHDEYLARYPLIADRLRDFFANLALVDAAISQSNVVVDPYGRRPGAASNHSGTPNRESWREGDGHPQLFAGFKILEELGSGGQGVIYKAEQLSTKRIVALKVLREGAFASHTERLRFENEVHLASRFNHPNIVAIYECARDRGREFFAMEYIEGETLDAYVTARVLDIPTTLRLFLQVCDAVNYAHQRGVIHRDLKPSNIIVDANGTAHILDFGLAKSVLENEGTLPSVVTQTGDFAGSWYYASPEQAQRKPELIDTRTDVYSLGVILFEMLTDCFPYPVVEESRDTIARHILETSPLRPGSLRGDLDDEIDTIVRCALQKDPGRRYQSAAALSEDIQRYLAGEAIEAKRDSLSYVLRKTVLRHKWRVAAAAISLVALISFAITVTILYAQAEQARATTEVRAQIVHDSQDFLLEKIDERNWLSARLAEIAEAHPELPEIGALAGTRPPTVRPDFEPLALNTPKNILTAMRATQGHVRDDANAWLRTHQAELEAIAEQARTTGYSFGIARTGNLGIVIADEPDLFGQTISICNALIAQALRHHREQRYADSVKMLDAARSIAVALGDARLFHQRTRSARIRGTIYATFMEMLGQSTLNGADTDEYAGWIFRDPPIAQLGLSASSERVKIGQLIEAATVAGGRGKLAGLDFDILYARVPGLFPEDSASLAELRTIAESVTPEAMFDVLDAYIRDVEGWDSLSWPELRQRRNAAMKRQREHRSWELLRLFSPDFPGAFLRRTHVDSQRSAALLATYACRYFSTHKRWPATLDAAIPARVRTLDPLTGQRFGYKLIDDRPLLYSLNEDLVDDGGIPGAWGQSQTDVVFLDMTSRRQ